MEATARQLDGVHSARGPAIAGLLLGPGDGEVLRRAVIGTATAPEARPATMMALAHAATHLRDHPGELPVGSDATPLAEILDAGSAVARRVGRWAEARRLRRLRWRLCLAAPEVPLPSDF